jgi:AbiV family abortive infection protein
VYATAAADNAHDLLDDAELLSGAGRVARAYSVAVLALEEFGKAACLVALAMLPDDLRARAPAGRMLEWHQLKQVGGVLIALVDTSLPSMAVRLAAMPTAQLARILDRTRALAQDADRLKLRGLYVDMDRRGRIREPSVITEAEVDEQLERARQVASDAIVLRDPDVRARLADPPAEAIELSRALFSALDQAGSSSRPKAAAAVLLKAVCELQKNIAASEAEAPSQPAACPLTRSAQ